MKLFVSESSTPAQDYNRGLGFGDNGIYAETEIELKAYERLTNFVARLNRDGTGPVDAGSHGLYYPDDARFVSVKVLSYDDVRGWYIKPRLARSIWATLCNGEMTYQNDIHFR